MSGSFDFASLRSGRTGMLKETLNNSGSNSFSL